MRNPEMHIVGDKLKKYRCTNGHEWESTWPEEIEFTVGSDPSLNIEHGCFRCLMDLVRDRLGTVSGGSDISVPWTLSEFGVTETHEWESTWVDKDE